MEEGGRRDGSPECHLRKASVELPMRIEALHHTWCKLLSVPCKQIQPAASAHLLLNPELLDSARAHATTPSVACCAMALFHAVQKLVRLTAATSFTWFYGVAVEAQK